MVQSLDSLQSTNLISMRSDGNWRRTNTLIHDVANALKQCISLRVDFHRKYLFIPKGCLSSSPKKYAQIRDQYWWNEGNVTNGKPSANLDPAPVIIVVFIDEYMFLCLHISVKCFCVCVQVRVRVLVSSMWCKCIFASQMSSVNPFEKRESSVTNSENPRLTFQPGPNSACSVDSKWIPLEPTDYLKLLINIYQLQDQSNRSSSHGNTKQQCRGTIGISFSSPIRRWKNRNAQRSEIHQRETIRSIGNRFQIRWYWPRTT